eukprot:5962797-Pleurochrysis_carterae.AAC.1
MSAADMATPIAAKETNIRHPHALVHALALPNSANQEAEIAVPRTCEGLQKHLHLAARSYLRPFRLPEAAAAASIDHDSPTPLLTSRAYGTEATGLSCLLSHYFVRSLP